MTESIESEDTTESLSLRSAVSPTSSINSGQLQESLRASELVMGRSTRSNPSVYSEELEVGGGMAFSSPMNASRHIVGSSNGSVSSEVSWKPVKKKKAPQKQVSSPSPSSNASRDIGWTSPTARPKQARPEASAQWR